MSRPPKVPGGAGPASLSGAGYASRLRDADWASQIRLRGAGEQADRTEVLYRWRIPSGESAGALMFQSLDGNPRHGVLALYLSGRLAHHEAIEILERQGRWLVMPNRARASMLAASALDPRRAAQAPSSRIAGTPDRRFVFFNASLDGGTVALVERRRDGDIPIA